MGLYDIYHEEYDAARSRHPSGPPKSERSDEEREAELRGGLADREERGEGSEGSEGEKKRLSQYPTPEPRDRRYSWWELYEMFYAEKRVSKRMATFWADQISERGVKEPSEVAVRLRNLQYEPHQFVRKSTEGSRLCAECGFIDSNPLHV